MIKAYVHSSHARPTGVIDTLATIEVEAKLSPLQWQLRGLQWTRSGYGSRIPTSYMIRFNGRWRRVYCVIYSNIGTLYIGKLSSTGERLIVDIWNGRSLGKP